MGKPAPNRGKDKPFRVYPAVAPEVYDKLRARAARNHRTLRSEVTAIIDEALERDEKQQAIA